MEQTNNTSNANFHFVNCILESLLQFDQQVPKSSDTRAYLTRLYTAIRITAGDKE
jgi:hypothetical protein